MNYVGAFLMMFGALGFGVGLLALALALVNPVTGGLWMTLALVGGAVGAEMVARWEGA
jgi:hypothetical protein